MFITLIDQANFEYDVNALVRSFYPGEQVRVVTPQGLEKLRLQMERDRRRERGSAGEAGQELTPSLEIHISEAGAELVYLGRPICWEYRPEEGKFKDAFKRFLYRTLSEELGTSLPWGNLTGIRPTKIAYGMLEEGKTGDEICGYLAREHYVSPRKAQLSVEIARRERELLAGVDCGQGYSLYLGIPFCPTTCLYCSFTSYPIAVYREQVDRYLDCLIREMEETAALMPHKSPTAVYIGGGTPTTLEPRQLERLLGALRERFDLGQVREFTVEAGRADSITEEKLGVLKGYGVSRISINPQTMKQQTLDLIGRRHTVEQVEEAFRLARSLGFDNINMDLILGLPGEGEADVAATLERVKALGPESLTVHSLAVKRASRLSRWILENGVQALRNTDRTMEIAEQGARELGMAPYYLYRQKNMSGNFENVGYARPGREGLYNILIMEEKQTIVACGAGTISKRVHPDGLIERSENLKEVSLYMDRPQEMLERKRKLFGDMGK